MTVSRQGGNVVLKPIVKNIPDELKALPNWVNWKKNKLPVNSRTNKAASSTDKKTWSEYDKAEDQLKRAGILGLGFVLTNSDNLVVIDIDNCIDKDGNLAPIAEFWINQFDSYTEVSPSGTGIHIFVRGHNIGTGKNLSKDRSKQKIGFEIYCTGRYFTVTGVPLEDYGECGDIAFNPTVVNLFYNTYFKKSRRESSWRPSDGPLAEGSRNTSLIQTAGSLARSVYDNASDDYSIEEKEEFLETVLYHLNDDYLDPPLPSKEIDNIINSAFKYLGDHEATETSGTEEADEDVAFSGNDEFNPRDVIRKYAFVTQQNKFINKETCSLLSREALDISTGHMKFYKKTSDGRRQVSFPEYFKLSSGKTVVDNVTWSPKREEIYTDTTGGDVFNTYKPLPMHTLPSKVKAPAIAPYLDLLRHVIPEKEHQEVFLDYLAFTLQHPEVKVNFGLILGSEYEGVGKDLLLRPVVEFMGRQCQEVTTEMLHSDFNHYLDGTKLLIVQEIYTSSFKDKRAVESRLKNFTAAPPDRLSVNIKNTHPFYIDNILSVIATTNHDDAIPVTNADTARRIYAIWSDVQPKSSEYYRDFAHWLYKKKGYLQVVGHLAERNVKQFNYTRSPGKTEFLERLSDSSQSSLFHRIKLMYENSQPPFNRNLIKVEDVIQALDDPRVNPKDVAHSLSRLKLPYFGAGTHGAKRLNIKRAGKTLPIKIYAVRAVETYNEMSGANLIKKYEQNHPAYSRPGGTKR